MPSQSSSSAAAATTTSSSSPAAEAAAAITTRTATSEQRPQQQQQTPAAEQTQITPPHFASNDCATLPVPPTPTLKHSAQRHRRLPPLLHQRRRRQLLQQPLLLRFMLFVCICQGPALPHTSAAILAPQMDTPQQHSEIPPQEPQHSSSGSGSASTAPNNRLPLHLPFHLPAAHPLPTTNHTFSSLSIIDGGGYSGSPAETEVNAAAAAAWTTANDPDAAPIFDFGMPRNITGRSGQAEAIIKCRVDILNDKSVSWIRKRDLHILTVGTATYTSDKRFQVTESSDSREWTLHVRSPQTRDSGIYECQVNTEPKISMAFQLKIIEIAPDAKAIISGPPDLHFKVGSAIILNCLVQQPSKKDIGPIYWYRGEQMITPFDGDKHNQNDNANAIHNNNHNNIDYNYNYNKKATATTTPELTNGIGADFAARIAMESQLGDTLKSRLRISNAQTADTGNYTCQPTTASSASVMVHVINDESPAAMQKSAAVALRGTRTQITTLRCIIVVVVVVGVAAAAAAANTVVAVAGVEGHRMLLSIAAAAAAVVAVSGCDVVLVAALIIILQQRLQRSLRAPATYSKAIPSLDTASIISR